VSTGSGSGSCDVLSLEIQVIMAIFFLRCPDFSVATFDLPEEHDDFWGLKHRKSRWVTDLRFRSSLLHLIPWMGMGA